MDNRLKRVTLEDFSKKNNEQFGLYCLMYKAWITHSADYLAKHFDIPFDDIQENLGTAQVALLLLNDDLAFKLSNLKSSPEPDITTIEMAYQCSIEQVGAVVKGLKDIFRLGPDEIVIPSLSKAAE